MGSLAPGSEGILVHAPIGQDARLIAQALEHDGLRAEVFPAIVPLTDRLRGDAGAVLLAEEALTPDNVALLNAALSTHEPWSDIPVVLLIMGGGASRQNLGMLRAFATSGNVTLLERPLRPLTLVSALQVALRARRRQYQMRRLLEEQIGATRAREEFILVASHELRTPLATLKLHVQRQQRQLARGGPLSYTPEQVARMVDVTSGQLDRLIRLVEDMLDVTRLNTGRPPLNLGEVDLAVVVQEQVDRLLPELIAAGCPVELRLERGCRGRWDCDRFQQVVTNLLTNVLRYAPRGPVWIEVSRRGSMARLVVRDSGPGIPAADQERIFWRFERSAHPDTVNGLGLGLYICREIVAAHEGTIRVESEPGQGAAFVVELPMTEGATGAAR